MNECQPEGVNDTLPKQEEGGNGLPRKTAIISQVEKENLNGRKIRFIDIIGLPRAGLV